MLDHGTINIPRHTAGINAELDRFKAQQSAQAKAKRKDDAKTLKAERAEAKALAAAMPDERVSAIAAKLGITPKAARAELMRMAHWTPHLIIKSEKRA